MSNKGFGYVWRSILGVAAFAVVLSSSSLRADDIINVDYSGVAARYRYAFVEAERRLDARLIGYRSDIPAILRNQLSAIQISASTPAIDGVGGILGQAAPTSTVRMEGRGFGPRRRRPWEIATAGFMQFDIADLGGLEATGSLVDVVFHEMSHVLGFGTLWAANELISADASGVTQMRFDGYALKNYRRESRNRFANFVPIEQQGGPGTALGHWEDDDPFFNQAVSRNLLEGLTGFNNVIINGQSVTPRKFISNSTWGAFADLGYVVKGVNDRGFRDVARRPRRRPKYWGGGRPDWLAIGASSVPEPGSAGVILLAFGVAAMRRRRS